MIHPINIEADLLASNPQRPSLIEPKKRLRITYANDGRRIVDGKVKNLTSPTSLWKDCFLRSFTHRLATQATAEVGETSSIDSFVDVVDLKPELEQKHKIALANRRDSSSSDDDILPATVIQGPLATSPEISLARRPSTKVSAELIAPLRKSCCEMHGFKEFLRFDFANSNIFKTIEKPTVFTPKTIGSRIWTRDADKPRPTLSNGLCFKISSVTSLMDKLAICVDVQNPTNRPVAIE
ncbi:hypothetical protein M3Y98_00624000 [Aphelenchoides besseyi]|nr:hypothetical protein M3Y98_00624000 [Aphelenchoides besseyi]KAI6208411.1 hypothetical protein M3Y96_00112100 [Aphelenchoides besseyi]